MAKRKKKKVSPNWDELYARYLEQPMKDELKEKPALGLELLLGDEKQRGKKVPPKGSNNPLNNLVRREVTKSIVARHKSEGRKKPKLGETSFVKNFEKFFDAAQKTVYETIKLPSRKWLDKEVAYLREHLGDARKAVAWDLKRSAMSVYRKVYSLKKKGK